MKIGDFIESSVWLTGEESPELRRQYEKDVAEAIEYFCHEHRFQHGPVAFTEKKPGADRVPPVPDHVAGPAVRLLIAESEITGKRPETSVGSFTAQLDKVDLQRLREITRRVRRSYGAPLSNRECDAIIEEIGPEAALTTLRKIVH